MKLALDICESSASVIARGKEFFYKQIEMDRKRAYKWVHCSFVVMQERNFCQRQTYLQD